MATIQIQGHSFDVPAPYAEGHTLSASEARALNQLLSENLRNNFAPRIKEVKGDATELTEGQLKGLQDELAKYATEYEFGSRGSGGGRTADPVEKEAMELARSAVRDAIRAQKGADVLKAVKAATISELARMVLDRDDATAHALLKQAREIVVKRQKAAQIDLSSLSFGAAAE